MKKWEYKVETFECEPYVIDLELYGLEGWELISIISKPNLYICYFKREIK